MIERPDIVVGKTKEIDCRDVVGVALEKRPSALRRRPWTALQCTGDRRLRDLEAEIHPE
jgi:hypothetical protein